MEPNADNLDCRRVAELVERVEAEAWVELQTGAPTEFRTRLGIEVCRPEGVALLARHTDVAAFNRVLAIGFGAPFTAARLEAIVAGYRDAGIPRFVLQWSPEARPAEAPSWFEAFGARLGSRMAKLCRRPDPDAAWATELRVIEIDASDVGAFAAVVSVGHGQPEMAPAMSSTVGRSGWRHYLALDGLRPVAGAALFAHGDTAWCGLGATLPGDRGRGAQSALLARRLRDAAAMGCALVACETMEDTAERPNPSYRNMRRLGFETVYLRPNYLFELGDEN